MKKKDAMQHWATLEPVENPLRNMRPIPYKSTGSKYGTCGIRIDGTPEYIDDILSRLKPLLKGESEVTRLELARNEVKPTEIDGKVKGYHNRVERAEVCYIRLHERGPQAKMFNLITKSKKDKEEEQQ